MPRFLPCTLVLILTNARPDSFLLSVISVSTLRPLECSFSVILGIESGSSGVYPSFPCRIISPVIVVVVVLYLFFSFYFDAIFVTVCVLKG